MRRGSFRIPEVTPILLGFIVATSDTDYALLRNAVRPDFRNAEFSLFVLIQKEEVEALFGNGEHLAGLLHAVFRPDRNPFPVSPFSRNISEQLPYAFKGTFRVSQRLGYILRHKPRFAAGGSNLFATLPFIWDGLGRTWEPRLVEDVIYGVLVEFKLFVQVVAIVISRCCGPGAICFPPAL